MCSSTEHLSPSKCCCLHKLILKQSCRAYQSAGHETSLERWGCTGFMPMHNAAVCSA
jgi:hypothetical protein